MFSQVQFKADLLTFRCNSFALFVSAIDSDEATVPTKVLVRSSCMRPLSEVRPPTPGVACKLLGAN